MWGFFYVVILLILTFCIRASIVKFGPESQDKFALAILKHKRISQLPKKYIDKWGDKFKDAHGDIIQMIIDGNIDKAILTASLEWASLPGSPYGLPQKTNKEVLKLYNKYLKQELQGQSDLHLKSGFLKTWGYE